MKKVFLDNLPRYADGTYKGKIDWTKSINKNIKFVNDHIYGTFTILDYDKQKQKIKIKYDDNIVWTYTNSLVKSRITRITKKAKLRKDFLYQIGDIINENKILDRFLFKDKKSFVKKYKYECLTCGHIGYKYEIDVTKRYCPVCNSRRFVDSEINSIKITHPEIFKLIIDDDADRYSYGSEHKVHWRCLRCKNINYTAIKNLTKIRPSGCAYCGDGFSYPEKVLYNVLSEVSNTYSIHKKFSWSKGREYDAFDLGNLIEIHGSQHYVKGFEACGGRTLEEEKENDLYKLKLAMSSKEINDYIVIKAYPENFETIKKNILTSKLSKYYDLKNVDWNKVRINSENSLVFEVGKMYENGNTFQEIMERYKISIYTVYRYLNKATQLGISNFIPCYTNESLCQKVRCKNTGEIFKSKKEAAKWCGLKSISGISKCVKGEPKYKTAGKHPVTGERLEWEYA